MAETMMALGDYRFSLDTAAYNELSRYHAERWSPVERIGRRPAMQHVGRGEERIDLGGVIYPTHRGGLGQVERMRQTAAAGEPLLMVTGYGEVLGEMVILSVEERQTYHFPDGAARKMEFRLSLAFYGEDSP